jgi:rhodanese-related sulfurtransferase/glyoxylase-like metal-dependent hydrolase (beta-lactamase superfamily II)
VKVIPFVHEGLGNSSYLVEVAPGKAVAVDPDRTAARYLNAAATNSLQVTAVLETHVHADFITGALEIASATGATVYTPSGSGVRYDHRPVTGGEGVRLGEATIEVLATPGHTPEHLAYTLATPGVEPMLFSGGSVIVGGAARTDLLGPELFEQLTRSQYHTLREAFSTLPDATALYPTHGGGSFCSAGAGSQRTSTLGEQRAMNPALGDMTEEEFLDWFPRGFPGIPRYYAHMRDMNQAGPRLRSSIAPPPPLSPDAFQQAANSATIIDTRLPAEYNAAHIRDSIGIPFRDVFGVWAGWLIELGTPLLFVANAHLAGAVDECLLVGHENFAGHLEGGVPAWEDAGLPTVTTPCIPPAEAHRLVLDDVFVLDVREPDEYAGGRIGGAKHVPLGDLAARVAEVPSDRPVLVYCGAGQRSIAAVSILERSGRGPLYNLRGGFGAWAAAAEPVVSG